MIKIPLFSLFLRLWNDFPYFGGLKAAFPNFPDVIHDLELRLTHGYFSNHWILTQLSSQEKLSFLTKHALEFQVQTLPQCHQYITQIITRSIYSLQWGLWNLSVFFQNGSGEKAGSNRMTLVSWVISLTQLV